MTVKTKRRLITALIIAALCIGLVGGFFAGRFFEQKKAGKEKEPQTTEALPADTEALSSAEALSENLKPTPEKTDPPTEESDPSPAVTDAAPEEE